jgi:hypothetical protein
MEQATKYQQPTGDSVSGTRSSLAVAGCWFDIWLQKKIKNIDGLNQQLAGKPSNSTINQNC